MIRTTAAVLALMLLPGLLHAQEPGRLWDVPPDWFFSAPWPIPVGTVPERSGLLERLEGEEGPLPPRTTLRPFDRVVVQIDGPLPGAGDRLQAMRTDGALPDGGTVVRPTGVLVVDRVLPGAVVAVVESLFDRLAIGDLVRPLPAFVPRPAGVALPAVSGPAARVSGFAEERALYGPGAHVFLDVGAGDGVRIGDEFVVAADEGDAERVQGRVKVVAVLDHTSTARVVHMTRPVFVLGVVLRPDRQVR